MEPETDLLATVKTAEPATTTRRSVGLAWAWSSTGAAIALAAVLLWNGKFRPAAGHASAGLSVRELDAGDQLRIDWNHASPAIQQGRDGALEIEDGAVRLHKELSQEYLQTGNITYLRTTGQVLVRLWVRGGDQSTLAETSLYRGPLPLAAMPAGVRAGSGGPVERPEQTDAAPVGPPETQAEAVPRDVRAAVGSANRATASVPVRRLVLPPSAATHHADPQLPAPPAVTASPNTEATMSPVVPRMLPAPSPPPAPVAALPAKHEDQGPQSGKIIWTGKLARGGTIQIQGNRASQGHLTGGLPGVPVRVRVFASELNPDGLRIYAADPGSISPAEAPGAQNGWNRTEYVLNPRKAGEIGLVEVPGQQNAWNRLTLRAERGDHAIIVLRWERVAPN